MSKSIKRYAIFFEFLGDNFFGSQIQPNKRTVQGELQKALNILFRTLKNEIKIIPSGRTDAKVSAIYQVAHFDSPDIENKDKFLYSLNSILPKDLKVFELKEMPLDFHAQKQAKYKHYRYTIENDHVASVFFKNVLFYPYKKLDIERINQSLKYLIGHKDFTSFASKSDNPYTDCTIYYAKAKEVEIEGHNFIFIDIIGNRFLYNMVRSIIGEILFIERNSLNPSVMNDVIEAKSRAMAKDTACALGLKLMYVGYDDVNNYINNSLKGR